jgi:hypothetical protein
MGMFSHRWDARRWIASVHHFRSQVPRQKIFSTRQTFLWDCSYGWSSFSRSSPTRNSSTLGRWSNGHSSLRDYRPCWKARYSSRSSHSSALLFFCKSITVNGGWAQSALSWTWTFGSRSTLAGYDNHQQNDCSSPRVIPTSNYSHRPGCSIREFVCDAGTILYIKVIYYGFVKPAAIPDILLPNPQANDDWNAEQYESFFHESMINLLNDFPTLEICDVICDNLPAQIAVLRRFLESGPQWSAIRHIPCLNHMKGVHSTTSHPWI